MKREKGSALLITLLFMALMAALAADMTISFQTQLQRSRRINDTLQVKYALFYSEAQARADLQKALQSKTVPEEKPEPAGKRILSDTTQVNWRYEDAQHCYNLNALALAPTEPLATPPYSITVFTALLEQAGVEKTQAREIVDSLADAIDPDTTPRRYGAEDEYYQQEALKPLPANQLFYLPSEVRRVKGMTPALYQKLSPYICAQFSSSLSININRLKEEDAPLLAALFSNDLTVEDAKALLNKRPEGGWKSVDEFTWLAQKEFSAARPLVDVVKKLLTTRSSYFRIVASAQQGELNAGMITTLLYDDKNSTFKIYQRQLIAGEED
ncbi:type II secretion system minor pseudopilin GspK [Enterobacter sp. ECC-219]|uniref:type II secretion system minor pseudopilin GspK n=1 Tax=Enterobacter sp. ECC-219 TaxID=3116480 RepID=UPI0012260ED1|nr:MAG: general secretion pathway protein GspK [Mesorhizobium sp.]